jgi:transposase
MKITQSEARFAQVRPHVAGIDIGAGFHAAAVRDPSGKPVVKLFVAETHGLFELRDFLLSYGIEDVAMEATGIYWIPVVNLLQEAGLRCALMNPRSLKGIPGKKTDVKDCQWIMDVYAHGFGEESFMPTREFAVIRKLARERQRTVQASSSEINVMIKNLRLMNVNLERAVSDVTGKTGLSVIDAIIGGERDPLALAELRDRRCRKSKREIALCLDGVYAPEHVFGLRLHRNRYQNLIEEIDGLDSEIAAALQAMAEKAGAACGFGPGHVLTDDLGRLLVMITANGVDLTMIEGIGANLALTILAEIGTDMSRWPTSKHFCSWLGLCPGSKISGGKVISPATRKVSNRAAWAFRMAACSLRRSNSALGCHLKKMIARQGYQKAITSTAHKIARLVYSLLKNGAAYVSRNMEIEARIQTRNAVRRTVANALRLGMTVELPDSETFDRMVAEKVKLSLNGAGSRPESAPEAVAAAPETAPEAVASAPETAPEAVVKRRGRPRKTAPAVAAAPETAPEAVIKRRGRPRKTAPAAAAAPERTAEAASAAPEIAPEAAVKRRGRPRKTAPAAAAAPERTAEAASAAPESAPEAAVERRGRPRKTAPAAAAPEIAPEAAVKRRGRPRKTAPAAPESNEAAAVKRKGRP